MSDTTDLLGAPEHSVNESYAACAETVPIARTRIGEFAARAGITGPALHSIRLAVSEAVTNVVRHAYRKGGGEVHVTAAQLADDFVLTQAPLDRLVDLPEQGLVPADPLERRRVHRRIVSRP